MLAKKSSTPPSWTGSDRFYQPYIGKGLVLFTGPDGICDHRMSVLESRYVGIGTMSPEGTSELSYLWRSARTTRHPPPKHVRVGEIGWNLRPFYDRKLLQSGQQTMRGEFRQLCEDRHTHLYQNPWYPRPTDRNLEDDQHSSRLHSYPTARLLEKRLPGYKQNIPIDQSSSRPSTSFSPLPDIEVTSRQRKSSEESSGTSSSGRPGF